VHFFDHDGVTKLGCWLGPAKELVAVIAIGPCRSPVVR
jgi:hypothetical protein